MQNSGNDFEKLTEEIYKKLVRDSKFEKVERNLKITCPDGERQIDIALTVNTMGLEIRTIVECKDHSRKIDVAYVDAIDSKMKDVKANKAVIVSKRGFTSGALTKARRLNISLCTAHEALSQNWGIDVEVPIIVHELTPLTLSMEGDFMEIVHANFEFYKSKFLINDKDIYSLIQERWNNGQLSLKSNSEMQKILLEDLPLPLYMRDANGNKIEFKHMRLTIESRVTTYLGNLNEMENTKLLKNITENKMTFLFDTAPIKDYKKKFRCINENDLPSFKSLSIIVATPLQIKNVQGSLINLMEPTDPPLIA